MRIKPTKARIKKTTNAAASPLTNNLSKQKNDLKRNAAINTGSAQLVLTPKMKIFEQRFEVAIKFKLNAKDTDQENNREGNDAWLQRAGYKEEEITDHLMDTFKRVFCRRLKPAVEALKISEEDQPWNYFWVRRKELSSALKGFLHKWLKFVKTLECNKNAYFERIEVTALSNEILTE